MIALSPEELEARVNAHRELLIDCLTALLGGQRARTALLERIRQDAVDMGHEEDPGAVPSEGLSIQKGMAREIRSILDAARARAQATND